MTDVLFAEARAKGCAAEIFLNGIPLGDVGGEASRRGAWPAETAVVDGTNHLTLRIVDVEDDDAVAEARLARFTDGDDVDSDRFGTKIAVARWAVGPGREGEGVTVSAACGPPRGRAAWRDAPPLVLDDALGDELAEALAEWAGFFTRGDGAGFVTHHRRWLEDFLAAYPRHDRAALVASSERFVIEQQPGRVEIAPRDTWALRLVAGDRLVDARTRDRRPILTLRQPDGLGAPYPALFGRDRGRLVMLHT